MGLGLDGFLAGWGGVLAQDKVGGAGGQGGGGGGGAVRGGDGGGGNG